MAITKTLQPTITILERFYAHVASEYVSGVSDFQLTRVHARSRPLNAVSRTTYKPLPPTLYLRELSYAFSYERQLSSLCLGQRQISSHNL